jgi:hypothetical protein
MDHCCVLTVLLRAVSGSALYQALWRSVSAAGTCAKQAWEMITWFIFRPVAAPNMAQVRVLCLLQVLFTAELCGCQQCQQVNAVLLRRLLVLHC